MQTSAALAYEQTARKTVSPRELEADLLIKAATRLQSVTDAWGSNPDISLLEQELNYNRKLWQVFAVSVTEQENPLPNALKESIASLAVFVFERTADAIGDRHPAKAGQLIHINKEIAAGLRGK